MSNCPMGLSPLEYVPLGKRFKIIDNPITLRDISRPKVRYVERRNHTRRNDLLVSDVNSFSFTSIRSMILISSSGWMLSYRDNVNGTLCPPCVNLMID